MSCLDTIIAGGAAFISLVALGLAIWQARATMKHNRLSVTPLLSFEYIADLEKSKATIRLKNCGVGPAIVSGYRVFLDGNEFRDFNRNPGRAIDVMFPDSKSDYYSLHNIEDVFESSEIKRLFSIREIPEESLDQACTLLRDRVSIIVEYRSIYHDEFKEYYNKDLA